MVELLQKSQGVDDGIPEPVGVKTTPEPTSGEDSLDDLDVDVDLN
jgi:hypothetical protein